MKLHEFREKIATLTENASNLKNLDANLHNESSELACARSVTHKHLRENERLRKQLRCTKKLLFPSLRKSLFHSVENSTEKTDIIKIQVVQLGKNGGKSLLAHVENQPKTPQSVEN